MAGQLVYVTYADGAFVGNYRPNAWFVRVLGGAGRTLFYARSDLEASPVYAAHRAIFDSARGAGLWAWKPWAILQAMEACGPDDVVFYHDCGFGLRYKLLLRPRRLISWAREHGFLAGVRAPQYGPNRKWNRAACRALMGGEEALAAVPTIEASVSFWPNTPAARAFVEQWLHWCLTWEAIRDARPDERGGEAPDFVAHRNDQSVLTNLVAMGNAPAYDPQPESQPFAKSVTVLELDLRSRDSAFYRLLWRAAVLIGQLRRG